MRKIINVFIMLLLTIFVFTALSCPASAYDLNQEDNSSDENTIEPKAVILPSIVEDGTALTLYTSISSTYIQDFKKSSTEVSTSAFSSSPSSSYLYISGCLNHSVTGNTIYDYMIRTGLCYKNYQTGTYVPDFAKTQYVDRGIGFTRKLCSISSLGSNTTYYLYVKNYFGEGYVYGDVGIYYVK